MANAICVAQSITFFSSNLFDPDYLSSPMSWLRSPPAQNSMTILRSCPSLMD